jgi:uncharacterized protein YndB with AHSA1/START domain
MTSTGKATSAGPRMSDEAVKAKTGKNWKEWFTILDKAGARKMSHQEIVKYLHEKQAVGPWWQQMVTVTYEQARGLRELHEKPAGYEISVSRTVNVPLAKLYKAFANEKARKAWLAEDGLIVRTATPNKSMRVTWNDGKTSLAIGFYSKGDNKSQVAAQHSKLADAKAAARMKKYWAEALDRLRASLEK